MSKWSALTVCRTFEWYQSSMTCLDIAANIGCRACINSRRFDGYEKKMRIKRGEEIRQPKLSQATIPRGLVPRGLAAAVLSITRYNRGPCIDELGGCQRGSATANLFQSFVTSKHSSHACKKYRECVASGEVRFPMLLLAVPYWSSPFLEPWAND